jgi:hypothetical protein
MSYLHAFGVPRYPRFAAAQPPKHPRRHPTPFVLVTTPGDVDAGSGLVSMTGRIPRQSVSAIARPAGARGRARRLAAAGPGRHSSRAWSTAPDGLATVAPKRPAGRPASRCLGPRRKAEGVRRRPAGRRAQPSEPRLGLRRRRGGRVAAPADLAAASIRVRPGRRRRRHGYHSPAGRRCALRALHLPPRPSRPSSSRLGGCGSCCGLALHHRPCGLTLCHLRVERGWGWAGAGR